MDLQKINAIGRMEGFLPTKPLSELTPKCKYAVTKLSKIQTKYVARIVAELNAEYVVFLPARLLKVLEEDPTTLEKMQEAASARRLQLRYLAGPYNNVEFKYVC